MQIKRTHLLTICFLLIAGLNVKGQTVVPTLRDTLIKDVNSNGIANPGDSVRYEAKIKVTGAAATGVEYNTATPANTTLGNNVKTSPLARRDTFTTSYNTVLSSGNVLTNDFGIPSPNVASYGTTGSPNTTSPAGTGATNNGGTVVITSAGALTYTPPASFVGWDQFAYKASNGNAPTNNAVVTVRVGTPASASNDAYNVIGNVGIVPNVSQGVLNNDAGTNIVVETVNGSAGNVGNSITTANGGTLNMSADGSFTYTPLAGWEGTDNFTYTCDNGFNSPASATVTLTVSSMVWFINSSYSGSTEDGRLGTPFKTISAFAAINDGVGNHPNTNEGIFVFTGGGYTNSITMLSGQSLLGQGGTITLSSFLGLTIESYTATLPSTSGTNPSIGGSITINTNNSLRGFTLVNSTSASISGSSFGTLSLSEVTINNANGGAISLTTGTCNCTFDGVTSGAGSNNISLTSTGGTITLGVRCIKRLIR